VRLKCQFIIIIIYGLFTSNFRHYSRGNAESANLKIIFLLIKCSLLAAVERLFSSAGLIMSHKRTKLTDRHFENLVFQKADQWLAD